jgi:hypothetical protein
MDSLTDAVACFARNANAFRYFRETFRQKRKTDHGFGESFLGAISAKSIGENTGKSGR